MAGKARSTIFRVQCLPLDDCENSITFLKSAFSKKASEQEMGRLGKVTITQSCYDQTRCGALVDWADPIPDFLKTLMKDSFDSVELETERGDISVDRHFLGFTQLYPTCADKPIVADIIALTGLDGHAYGSFRGKGNLGRMWLRDFLSTDLPNCRTMIYGYDSKLSNYGLDKIIDYGRKFLEEVKKIRRSAETRQRPVFFIAHSFGGLILAHSLVQAYLANENGEDSISSLYRSWYGVLFFGTPHKGLVIDDIEKVVADGGNRQDLLQQIRKDSDLLMMQLSDFKNRIQDRKIVSFHEMKQTKSLERDPNNMTWARSGHYFTAVDMDSAVLQLPDFMETKIPLNLDHSQMVKFDNQSTDGYRSALHYLKEFSIHAPAVVKARFSGKASTYESPKPSLVVPFRRDPNFVGREDVFEKLDANFSQPEVRKRAAVHGLGGVGKSQIAIEYAYRLYAKHPQTWIFWIYAGTAARFQQAYREIAIRVKLPGIDDPEVNVTRLVVDWLSDERNGEWLIVLDNADDPEVFRHVGKRSQAAESTEGIISLEESIPDTSTGTVLITSRNRELAFDMVQDGENIVDVDVMDECTAVALLRARGAFTKKKKANKEEDEAQEDEDNAKELVRELDYLPLAISHAGAYINKRAPRMTISRYITLFRSNDSCATTLLETEVFDPRRDREKSPAALKTWQISFDQIRNQAPDAAQLLSRMSVLDRQSIPATLCREGYSEIAFENDLGMLLAFALVSQEIQEGIFTMHRLVQMSTQKWLEIRDELRIYQSWALTGVSQAFPIGMFENKAECELLLPHAEVVSQYHFSESSQQLSRATLSHNYGWYLATMGDYVKAEQAGREALDIRAKLNGYENTATLASMAFLGSILRGLQRWEEAERLELQVLDTRKSLLGDENHLTLTGMANLASTYRQHGRLNDAEKLQEEVTRTRKRLYGEDDVRTLSIMANLAATYQSQERWNEAEQLQVSVLNARKRCLSDEHPRIMAVASRLAITHINQGRFEEAVELQEDVMRIARKHFGNENYKTVKAMEALAQTYRKLERWKDAEELEAKIVETRSSKTHESSEQRTKKIKQNHD